MDTTSALIPVKCDFPQSEGNGTSDAHVDGVNPPENRKTFSDSAASLPSLLQNQELNSNNVPPSAPPCPLADLSRSADIDRVHFRAPVTSSIPCLQNPTKIPPPKFDSKTKNFTWGGRPRVFEDCLIEEYRVKNGFIDTGAIAALEAAVSPPNYAPTEDLVISRAQGSTVWDVQGRPYLDFLSGVSSLSHGHCHPDIVKVICEQAKKLTLTCRVFSNDCMPIAAKQLVDVLGYEKVLFMNTGAEAGEAAVKLARKWGYERKGIPLDQAKVIVCSSNYWGRTLAACSSSDNFPVYNHFGPYITGFEMIPFNNSIALEATLADPCVCGFLVEPVQGEGGVQVCSDTYLSECSRLCAEYNVLFIVDEVQAGLCRTGRLLTVDYFNVKPDLVLLGKSLGGGCIPISAVCGSKEVLDLLTLGTHGSTYGGNPLACAVAYEAVRVCVRDNLSENAFVMGELFRSRALKLHKIYAWIKEVRGLGLLNAIEVDAHAVDPMSLCLSLKTAGLLVRTTRGNVLRFIPPLVITEEEMEQGLNIMQRVFAEVNERLTGPN